MEALREVTALAAPLMRANVDTDQIIPTRFLARPTEEGLGEGLFAEWAADPQFVLNRSPWTEAGILLAGANFGCGSSREAAPRALRQRGFRAVIAPSFGDIFFNNCFRNGIVPVRLPMEAIERFATAGGPLKVDLAERTVTILATGEVQRFEVPPRLQRMLLEGLDEIALTKTQQPAIDDYRTTDRARRPWAYL
ncbi:3-isopropylmalate dehydratase small subunit [Ramlibacter albus]|uniref:3-isopropylmalate dehydratase n=1 Tax=Ramlibacter albus TaxID=2079448 RepID=A0A923S470_9BURK|nr:3-isopropylmalate dehydratase small subunit [Ramlibacter albus]MBC5767299.1 3-isopropylmalate dehydratase small subunit [Ramlibacter albus]